MGDCVGRRTVVEVTRRSLTGAIGALAALVLTGCAGNPPVESAPAVPSTPERSARPQAEPPPATPRSTQSGTSTTSPSEASDTAERPEPRRSYLSIAGIGLDDFPVVRYPGRPDDAPGTAIQNAGPMASPRGPRGGVGPGEVGNFIVTGHRTSHTMPFADLPTLQPGERVRVRSGDQVHVYEITRTRWTSFRRPASRAAQEAPVPGRPGVEPTRAMITLSTCATPEDHAAGNYWSDRFGNPEHRIDKIGVLVRSVPA